MKRGEPLKRRPLRADAEKVREFMQRGRYRPKAEPRVITCARVGCDRRVLKYASDLRKGAKYCSRECWRLDRAARRTQAIEASRASVDVTRRRQGAANPAYRHGKRAGVNDRAGKRRFRSGQVRCVHPDCKDPAGPNQHEHHVVYEQHVRREGGDVWDPRNALRLCVGCHSSHHRRGKRVVPLSALRDENYAFAFELLGRAAEVYLRRRYSGEDPRLQMWIERAEAAAASSGGTTSLGGDDGAG